MSHRLYRLLKQLDGWSLSYVLGRHRPDSVMVTVNLVGSRVEIDVFDDGHIEYSVFAGSEAVHDDEAKLERMLRDG